MCLARFSLLVSFLQGFLNFRSNPNMKSLLKFSASLHGPLVRTKKVLTSFLLNLCLSLEKTVTELGKIPQPANNPTGHSQLRLQLFYYMRSLDSMFINEQYLYLQLEYSVPKLLKSVSRPSVHVNDSESIKIVNQS